MHSAVFYVPRLRPERNKAQIPSQVAFFPVGLMPREGDETLRPTDALEEEIRTKMPLDPAQARATLEEMLRMGEEYAAGGLLRQLAAQQVAVGQEHGWSGKPGERAALERFAATGAIEGPAEQETMLPRVFDWDTGDAKAIRQALVDCQKTLLLAYTLEERAEELADLERRCGDMELALRASLGEGDPRPAAARESSLADGNEAAASSVALPWRFVVDAVLPFLPEGGVLFTMDPDMTADMRAAGILQPLPEDKVLLCAQWPEDLIAGLLFASIPAWRLVGRKGPLSERPWLKSQVEILAARPACGWSGSGKSEK